MIERTNVKEMDMLPEGRYKLTVSGKPEKTATAKSHYRTWNFKTDDGRKLSLNIFPWKAKDLLLALGGKLDPKTEEIEWDDDKVDGLEIEADLDFEPYQKKDGTEGKSPVLRNIEGNVPF